MGNVSLSTALNHYKRKEVQEAIIAVAKNREIVGSFNGEAFSKRPDVLQYPNDIIEQVKQGVTSFHMSEEHWSNVQRLSPMLKRQDIDALRSGWDLILDIDSPDWELSKIITDAIIKQIKNHNVKSVSCKFSGNKGFHIAVPFEAFPTHLNGKEIRLLFPDACRKIAQYLVEMVAVNKDFINKLDIDNFKTYKKKYCDKCNHIINIDNNLRYFQYGCMSCGNMSKHSSNKPFIQCPECKKQAKILDNKPIPLQCPKCKNETIPVNKPDMSALINVDTILISTRHLLRMPYSLHEKSGKVSIPVNIDKVLEFNRDDAEYKNLKISEYKFLDSSKAMHGEATQLILQAYDYNTRHPIETSQLLSDPNKIYSVLKSGEQKNFEELTAAIPVDFFPPCMKIILNGMQDGRKRALFILVNFLSSCGYGYEKIEEMLYAWNKKNPEEMREVYLVGQLRYHKQQNKKILPPNCPHTGTIHYKDIGVCQPDNLCMRIKNPVQYAKKKAWLVNREKKVDSEGNTGKWSDERKEKMKKVREERKMFKEEVKRKKDAGELE